MWNPDADDRQLAEVQTRGLEVWPAHGMDRRGGFVHFDFVRDAIIVAIAQAWVGTVDLLFAIGEAILIEVLVTVADAVVVGIGVVGVGADVELVEVAEAIAVEVGGAVEQEGWIAAVDLFPPVR